MFGVVGQVMGNAIQTLENNIDQDLKQSLRNVVDLVLVQAVIQDHVKVKNPFMKHSYKVICKFNVSTYEILH